ncbi:alpha/beta fold hydrolase [Actinomycetospora lemnae]|uniref:Alpha/beta hydrolase n=1 Tax=Actinomycetospora lemnae TaxID=3019891 RepID=A0ABT5SZK5_9PSEU|nr:alpha/beta hydrolase [Actinomycetospora sp. DW7H6]MDD7968295.1 alpha/beta hydrolase [Actinomycetospora sp. DW7H6]
MSDLLPAPGPPSAVAVPGLGLTVRGWRGVAARLDGTLPTAVVALPAFGLRVPRGTRLDPPSLADRLVERLRDLATGPVVLCGHSASCQVVAEAARRHPAAVRGLVLVGPTTDPRAPTWPSLAGRWLRTAAHEDPRRVPGIVGQYVATRLSGFGRTMDAARRHDLRAALAGSRVPVLLVRGPHDRLAPAAWLAELAAVRAGITVVTTAHGAHMVPLTHPDELAGVCREQFPG